MQRFRGPIHNNLERRFATSQKADSQQFRASVRNVLEGRFETFYRTGSLEESCKHDNRTGGLRFRRPVRNVIESQMTTLKRADSQRFRAPVWFATFIGSVRKVLEVQFTMI